MAKFTHDGIEFNYVDIGTGLPFVFEHGLGADSNQVLEAYRADVDVRLISLDCRGHGGTVPLGSEDGLSINTYVEDLVALLDHLGIYVAVVGGISMGAALALRFAIAHPERLAGLVLTRLSVLNDPWPPHLMIFGRMGSLIHSYGAELALPIFEQDADFLALSAGNPYTAEALTGQFLAPRAEEAVERLVRIPGQTSFDSWEQLRRISAPTLVMASELDPIHPFDYGTAVAHEIPRGRFLPLVPKTTDAIAHLLELQANLSVFLAEVNQLLLAAG